MVARRKLEPGDSARFYSFPSNPTRNIMRCVLVIVIVTTFDGPPIAIVPSKSPEHAVREKLVSLRHRDECRPTAVSSALLSVSPGRFLHDNKLLRIPSEYSYYLDE
ncbi:Hypothetical protein CINCED_3A002609 [Cinara cedri]|uniref:Uncharacterized protein n=1 Tax=Cinara cedri TaxID=506608 RepID=A0A5E4MAA9_9HEMI|nr:Hypothetical protein CINCED_3A002609 [Cinara cedri]